MPPSDATLARLRREIDKLDDQIADLIAARAGVVARIGKAKAKTGAPVLRPGREAAVLRRLVARHKGEFPKAALVRIWREIMAASAGLQAPLSLAVTVPNGDTGYCELARAHFGSVGPLAPFKSPGEVIGAVSAGKAGVGIVPAPSLDDPDPWWRILAGSEASVPRVIARLPITGIAGGAAPELAAMAVAVADPGESGDDRTLVVIEPATEVSRAAISSAVTTAGLELHFMDFRTEAGGGQLVLLELGGFMPADDARLDQLAAGGVFPIKQLHWLGAYPAPFAPSDLGIDQ